MPSQYDVPKVWIDNRHEMSVRLCKHTIDVKDASEAGSHDCQLYRPPMCSVHPRLPTRETAMVVRVTRCPF